MKEFLKKIKEWAQKAWAWIGQDGLLHFSISALIMFALGWVRPFICGVAITIFIGLLKEVVDTVRCSSRNQQIDIKHTLHDIACDIAGVAVGLLLVWINILGR